MYLEGLRRRAQATPRGGLWMRRRTRAPRNGAGTRPPEMQVLGAAEVEAEAEAAASGSTVAISARALRIFRSPLQPPSTWVLYFCCFCEIPMGRVAAECAYPSYGSPCRWAVVSSTLEGPCTFTPAFGSFGPYLVSFSFCKINTNTIFFFLLLSQTHIESATKSTKNVF